MLDRALDIVNKRPRDIGNRWRQNLVNDVVSVVVTVVIVNTVKPLLLRNRFRERYCPLLTTSGQLFTSHSPLLGEKPSIIESSQTKALSSFGILICRFFRKMEQMVALRLVAEVKIPR